ncbi:glycosyltransferase [Homoserinimonas hongtaonis]|uniref:glycosyltransferase n=1 Tax=Homoserinimonas hongtaonis TaxID=2079791 RepID=UPI00131F331A|nr:glycosyltransferase [Salinibacterium hongtaonis]
MRVYDWFDHLGIPSDRFEYVGTSDNQPARLAKNIPNVCRAEVSLRALEKRVGHVTLLLSRQASPFSSGAIEERLLRAARRGVYDFDDALKFDTGSWTRRLWSKEKVWARSVSAADVVIAGSDVLAAQAREYSDNVVMIPSCVEPRNYSPKRDYGITSVPRAVWIGSPATEPLLRAVGEPLLELNKRFGLRIAVVSAGNTSLGRLDPMVDREQWTAAGFANCLTQADFGIMPLNDTPYSRGKCSYKLLQYAASGLPLVGSPVGANAGVLKKLGGTAAGNNEEWIAAIGQIIEMSDADRSLAGMKALDGVTRHFSFGAWEKQWSSAMALGTETFDGVE